MRQPPPAPPPLARMTEFTLYAEDLRAAHRFYTRVLRLTVVARDMKRGLVFRCGGAVLLVFNPRVTRISDGRLPPHGTRGAGHVAFPVAAAHLDRWRAHFAAHGVAIEKEVTRNDGTSIYFRDPARNVLELAPPGLWGLRAPHISKRAPRTKKAAPR